MILTGELPWAQKDTQQRRQTLLVISVQRRCPQDRERGSMPGPGPSCPGWAFEGRAWLDQFLLLHLKHWGWRAQGWLCFWPLMSSVQCNDFCEGIQFLSPSP